MVAALETEDEVSLLLEAQEQVSWRFNLDIWILLLLHKHSESIVEADVRNQVAGTYVLLLFRWLRRRRLQLLG